MRAVTKILRHKRSIIDPNILLTLECIGFLCFVYSIYVGMTAIIPLIIGLHVFGTVIIAGNHRLLSHNSWPCPLWLRNAISLISVLTLQGPPIAWVAVHREHHHKTDCEGDPHSPLFKSRTWIQFCSMQYTPNLTYATDMWKDAWQKFLFDYYWVINISFCIFLMIVDPLYVVIWIAVAFVTQMSAYAVNSVCHHTPKYWLPSSERSTSDSSRNVWVLAWLTGGESWHLNHHRAPWKWYFGNRWYQVDITGVIIFIIILLTNPRYFFKTHKNSK